MERDICRRTFVFATDIVRLCKEMERRSAVCQTMSKQLLRSATSVRANVEEAQCAQSRADFVSKMHIACKEARETNYWLRIMRAAEVSSSEQMTRLLHESDQLVSILTAIIKNTKANVT